MISLILQRATDSAGGTYGTLYLRSKPLCFVVERPWLSNQRNVSCIPIGTYRVEWDDSPKFGRALHLRDVPGRLHILLHAGNRPEDSEGCLLPNCGVEWEDGKPVGRKSRIALDRVEKLIPDDGTQAEITIL